MIKRSEAHKKTQNDSSFNVKIPDNKQLILTNLTKDELNEEMLKAS